MSKRYDTPTDRMIITTYYTDATRLYVTKVIRSKYPRLASMRAFDNMSMNMYGADVCVIYDDEVGKHHLTLVRHKDGNVETEYQRDQTNPKFTKFGSFKLQDPKITKAKIKAQIKRLDGRRKR